LRPRRPVSFAVALTSALVGTAVLLAVAQDEPAVVEEFEELPELRASEILKPELMQGPHHTIREQVRTFSGMNEFVIDSEYGLFPADGNKMLLRRLKEVYAIAQLKDVSRGDQFKDALVTAAKSPLNAAKNIVRDPVKAVSSVPKGVMKFVDRAGDSIKNIGKKGDGNEQDGSKAEQLIGYSKVKRKLAVELGVDPYSTNAVLQKELDGVAWATWAGGFAFRAATLPISGPIGAALAVTNVSSALENLLRDKSPAELKEINQAALRSMGAGAKETDRLLSNSAFSPSQVTEFILHLKTLDGVANRAAFVRTAAEQSSSEADASFCVQTASLMSQIHKDAQPLARIAMIGNLPIAIAKDGTVILALEWDYAAWTSGAASVVEQVAALASESGEKRPAMVVLSGEMSPRLQQELQKRGITVQSRASPGPLK